MSENRKEVEVVVRLGSGKVVIEIWRDRDEKEILVMSYISAKAKMAKGSVEYIEITTPDNNVMRIEKNKELEAGEIVKNITLRIGIHEW
jgi:hypothetical protein